MVLATMATLGGCFRQFEKVAKRLRGLATNDDEGDILAIIRDVVAIPSHHRSPPHCQKAASMISVSMNGA